jgi:hypothetical protein
MDSMEKTKYPLKSFDKLVDAGIKAEDIILKPNEARLLVWRLNQFEIRFKTAARDFYFKF